MILGLKSCFKSLEFSLGVFVSFFCCACVTAVQKNLLGLVCWVTAEKMAGCTNLSYMNC